jgi:DNA-binding transcriptional LysR family regulator
MFDLRRLHVLRVVHQLGTVTAAAHSLHLTPSAISQQLRQLAHELDVPLLEPDGRRVRLTPAAHTLLTGDIDIAVTLPNQGGPPLDDPRFEQETLLDEPLDLLVPRDHPLAGTGLVALEEVAHEPWILPAPGTCDHQEISAAACAAAGFTPKVAHEAMDLPAIAAIVAAGLGVCLKPRLVQVPAELPVASVPLSGPAAPRRRLLTCTRRGSRGQPHIAAGLDALTTAAAAATAPRIRPAS